MARSRTSYAPGTSGNPLGRPKAALDVQQLARAHTVEAIATLVRALDHPRHCVQAAQILLDRAWGKPVATVVGAPELPLHVEFTWQDADPAPAAKAAEHVVRQAVAAATDEAETTDLTWDKAAARLPN